MKLQLLTRVIAVAAMAGGCSSSASPSTRPNRNIGDWTVFRSQLSPSVTLRAQAGLQQKHEEDRFTFGDLKNESDRNLAKRLLGAAGERISLVDRRKSRWRYYKSDNEPVEAIDLYTKPAILGSQFGICGVEKYTVNFDDFGKVSSVSVVRRYGVEGPFLQKSDFTWDQYRAMCAAASPLHAPNYFPAPSGQAALDVASLLAVAITQAGTPEGLGFRLSCTDVDGGQCAGDIRAYLAQLRFNEIFQVEKSDCHTTERKLPKCFVVHTGEHLLGPFPKAIRIGGSTYMNEVRVDAIEIQESFTMS
jgi:hypothetical protein